MIIRLSIAEIIPLVVRELPGILTNQLQVTRGEFYVLPIVDTKERSEGRNGNIYHLAGSERLACLNHFLIADNAHSIVFHAGRGRESHGESGGGVGHGGNAAANGGGTVGNRNRVRTGAQFVGIDRITKYSVLGRQRERRLGHTFLVAHRSGKVHQLRNGSTLFACIEGIGGSSNTCIGEVSNRAIALGQEGGREVLGVGSGVGAGVGTGLDDDISAELVGGEGKGAGGCPCTFRTGERNGLTCILRLFKIYFNKVDGMFSLRLNGVVRGYILRS